MGKYDDASWHYGGDFPKDLQPENGATHIGFFLCWCINNQLASDFLSGEFPEDVVAVLNRAITGRDFIINNCDGKLTDDDLSDVGNAFAEDYYEDEGGFAKKEHSYLEDFSKATELFFKEFDEENKTAYHIEDSWEFYDAFAELISMRFKQ